jgi:nucleoside-diphosphate-sugar epimerase
MERVNKRHPLYQEDLKNILKTKGVNNLKGKTFLITGATGLIGTQLIDALMLLGDAKVIAVGRSKEKAKQRFSEYYGNNNFMFIEQKVTEPFPRDLKVDFIVPLASNTHPLAYSKYPVDTMLVNFIGAKNALDLAVECEGILLYPSSNEIYGNAYNDEVFSEGYTGKLDLSNSRSCYTESKRSSEALCQSYAAEFGVRVKIARLTRTFGPSVLPTDTKASSQFIMKALSGEDIVLKSKGEQYFSYTYVADAVSGLLYVLLHGKDKEAYNISNEFCNVHLKDFAQACADYAGTKLVFDLPSDEELRGYSVASKAILNNQKILALGWKPMYSFSDAVKRTIEIIKDAGIQHEENISNHITKRS